MPLIPTYKTFIDLPVGGEVEVKPINDDFEFTFESEKEFAFKRRALSTRLRMRSADYTVVRNLEQQGFECTAIPFHIDRKQTTGLYDVFHEGYLSIKQSGITPERAQMEVATQSNDIYSCVLNKYEEEFDILGPYPTYTIVANAEPYETSPECNDPSQSFNGLVIPTVQDGLNGGCITDSEGWVLKEVIFLSSLANPTIFTRRFKFIRTRVTSVTQPEGGGWYHIGGDEWVRKPAMYPVIVDEAGLQQRYIYNPIDTPIDNAVRLNDILTDQIGACGLEIHSNLLGINADGLPSEELYDPYIYSAAYQFLHNQMVLQKTDVKTPVTDSEGNEVVNATIGLTTLKELFELLEAEHQAQWAIIQGVFRIEHESYFRRIKPVIDLTVSPYARFIKQILSYEYETDKLPRKETFVSMDETNQAFDGVPIEYGRECSDPSQEISHKAGRFTANVAFILNNPDKIANEGFCIVTTAPFQGNNLIMSQMNELTGEDELNGHLAWPNLQDRYYRTRRYQKFAMMNNQDVEFDDTIPDKLQKELVLKMTPEAFKELIGSESFGTFLGIGEIADAKYSLGQETLTLSLIYETVTA